MPASLRNKSSLGQLPGAVPGKARSGQQRSSGEHPLETRSSGAGLFENRRGFDWFTSVLSEADWGPANCGLPRQAFQLFIDAGSHPDPA